jgi:hypothetical protein
MQVTLSTQYASSIRLKSKTFILFLRKNNLIEMYGAGINPAFPMTINIDNLLNEIDYNYDESVLWEEIKNYKKELRKREKALKKGNKK